MLLVNEYQQREMSKMRGPLPERLKSQDSLYLQANSTSFTSICNRLSSFVQMYCPSSLSPEPRMRSRGGERETAPSASAQDPGILNKQSGQGLQGLKGCLLGIFHRREIEMFWLVMSLGQGVSSNSMSDGNSYRLQLITYSTPSIMFRKKVWSYLNF